MLGFIVPEELDLCFGLDSDDSFMLGTDSELVLGPVTTLEL